MNGTATVKFRIAVDVEVQLPIETEKISAWMAEMRPVGSGRRA